MLTIKIFDNSDIERHLMVIRLGGDECHAYGGWVGGCYISEQSGHIKGKLHGKICIASHEMSVSICM